MKNVYLLLIATMFFGACKKEEKAEVQGILTAKIDLYDAISKKWSGNQDFIATQVITIKTNNDYTIKASDAVGNAFTLTVKNVTAEGAYTDIDAILIKAGQTYTTKYGKVTISEVSSTSLKATFIFENAEWSVNSGMVEATF